MFVGRGPERARIAQMLAGARLGTSSVLVVVGEPGIGKTALVEQAVAAAGDMAVLRARGVPQEADVPFAGLFALLRPALARLDDLPAPQAAALRTALALEAGEERDRFAIGAATLGLLAAHAEHRPVLVVVDDAHWLDAASLAAVTFAARRLLADAVAVLIATRPDGGVDGSLPALELGGLGRDEAPAGPEHVPGPPPPPRAADRTYARTLGNPLALVELADAASEVGADTALPVQTSVERAFARRVEALPEPARRALALTAADGAGDLATLRRAAAELEVDLAALDAAEAAGLVTVAPTAVAFAPPLASVAAYRCASAAQRREAHRALSAACADPDRRAWHLAEAALGPDAEAARALDGAARRARSRSAYAAAASAFERAARLTDEAAGQAPRLLAAAEAAWLGGDAERAERLLDEVAAHTGAGDGLRDDADHLRGHVALRAGRVMEAHDILSRVAERDPRRAVIMLAEAADACAYAARPAPMLAVARRAHAALADDAPELDRFYANLALGMAFIYNGRGDEGAGLVREAVDILARSDALSGDPRLLASAALGPLWLRERAASRDLVARAIDAARAQGAVGALPFSLWLAARDAATSDRWAIALARYEEAPRLPRETGQATALTPALAGMACVEARQGQARACREHAAEALALTERLGLDFFALWALDALAELDLGLGDPRAALTHLERTERLLDERGIADPDVSPVPELVEALLRLDRAEDARDRLTAFAERAEAKGQPWALARLARCRGLLGELDAFDTALALHAETPDRFEEARTRLCHGEHLRRARRRVDAREALGAALDAFEALGAVPWADRARDELQAT